MSCLVSEAARIGLWQGLQQAAQSGTQVSIYHASEDNTVLETTVFGQ